MLASSTPNRPDILIYMSDQHDGRISGYGGNKIIRTPNLDKIASEGTVFANTYTSCPLCIPARMSFLTGQLPSNLGILELVGSIPSETSTFMHSLGAEGYENVLCGRMHFEGEDQRHGFTKRIMGDITSLHYGYMKNTIPERGKYAPTLAEIGCLQIIGGGNSPTLEYDREVTASALDYLSGTYDKPQCIVVGAYAPHFPYVSPKELYDYYYDKVELPNSSPQKTNSIHPLYKNKYSDSDPEIVRGARAAYYGMIEFMDENIGMIYEKWNEYLRRTGREGVFIYLSDHGDQNGDRGLYGKKTPFESSTRIPLIIQGTGVPKGITLHEPVSIMDLAPTLNEIAGADQLPEQGGVSLLLNIQSSTQEPGRTVVSEFLESNKSGKIPGRMIVKDNFKFVTYYGFDEHDMLFNLSEDPDELNNIIDIHSLLAKELKSLAYTNWDPEDLIKRVTLRNQHMDIQRRFIMQQEADETERWKTSAAALEYPDNYLTSKVPMPTPYHRIFAAKPSE